MATLPNPNPMPNQGALFYSYTVDPSLPNISSNILSNTVYSQVNVASLNFVKTVTPSYSTLGSTVQYTMVVTNTGNINAINVSFLDTVPTGLSYVNGTLTVNGVANAGNPNTGITLPNIVPNGSTTIIFSALVGTIPVSNPINNQGITNYSYIYDPSTPNSIITATISNIIPVTINQAFISNVDGGLVKAVNPKYATLNQVLTYTIVVKNTGNTIANSVVISDTIPTTTTFVPGSLTVNGVNNAGNIQTGVSLGNLIPGAFALVQFQVTVNSVPNPNTIPNTAVINYTYTDNPSIPNGQITGSISNIATTTISYVSFNQANGGFTKTVNVVEATIGDTITYSLVLTNLGNTIANNVIVRDTIPSGTTFVASSVYINGVNSPLSNPGTGVNLGSLSPGVLTTVTFQVLVNTIPVPNPIPNQGVVSYSYTVDPSTPNGTSITELSTLVNTQVNFAAVSNVKSVSPSIVAVGDTVTYTLVLKNSGNVSANNVIITDTIPVATSLVPGSVYVNSVANGGTPNGGITVGSIGAGQTATVQFQVLVNTLPGSNVILNTASLGYGFTVSGVNRPYTNTSNQTTTSIVNVAVATNKVASTSYADLGEEIQYTVLLSNSGNANAINVVLTDTAPNGTTFVANSVTLNGVNVPGANPTTGYTVGTIPGGQTYTVTFRVLAVSIATPNPFSNTAVTGYSYIVDPTSTPRTGTSTGISGVTQINNANFNPNNGGIVKSESLSYAAIGDVITYTVVLKNLGNVNANNAIFIDTVPSNTSFVNGSVTVNGVANAGNPSTGISLGSLVPTTSYTVIFNVTVTSTLPTSVASNTAFINYSYTVNPLNAQATNSNSSNTVTAQINAAVIDPSTGGIVKTSDSQYVTKDQIITYTVVIKNSGNVSANNVVVSDTIPAATNFVANSVYVNGVNYLGVDINPPGFLVPNIPAGGMVTVQFQVIVNTVPNPNVLSNSAMVNYNYTTDPSLPNGKSGGGISPSTNTSVNYASFNHANGGFTKTTNIAQATVGDNITYTLVLINLGNTIANNVVVKDTIPNGTTFVPSSIYVNGSNLPTGNIATGINIGSLSPGIATTIIFQVQVNTIPSPNPIPNQGVVSYTYTVNPSIPNGTSVTELSTIVNTQVNYAEISNTKTVSPSIAAVGDTVTYTLALTNTGNVSANNVIVTDTVPTATSFILNSVYINSVSNVGNPNTGINVGNISPGQTTTVQFQVMVNTLPTNGNLLNTASTGYGFTVNGVNRPYTNTSNQASSSIVYVDVATNKVASTSYADLGSQIQYTVLLSNSGNANALNTFLLDTIPNGTTFVQNSVMLNGVNVPGANPTTGYTIGTIPGGQTYTVTFNVLVESIPTPNPIQNIAGTNYNYIVDPTSTPRTGISTGTSGPTQINNANFNTNNGGLTKSESLAYATIGDIITYTVVLKNLGNVNASNSMFIDTVPSNTVFVNGSATVNGVAVPGNPSTGISLGTITPGAPYTVTFNAQVLSTLPTSIASNTAFVNYSYTVDPVGPQARNSNNSNTVNAQINAAVIDPATGGIVKTSDNQYVTKNQVITYTVTVKNSGNVSANNVLVSDTIPSATNFIANSIYVNGVNYPGANINPPGIVVPNIPAGGTSTVQFQVIVNTVPNPNILSNNAVVNYNYTTDPSVPNGKSGGGISPNTNTSVYYAGFTSGNGGYSKSVDLTDATIGQTVTYTLTLTNLGNTIANNVVFKDTIPVATTFIAASVYVNGISMPVANPQVGINLGSIQPLQTSTVVFKVLVVSVPTQNPIENQGSVNYSYTVNPTQPNGINTSDLSSIAQTTVSYASISTTDGGFNKSADYSNVVLGGNIVYTITLRNTGNVAANNVIIQDTLPSEVSYVPNSLIINGVANSGNVQLGVPIGTILPGSIVTARFTVQVNSLPSGGITLNTANVNYGFTVGGSNVNVNNVSNTSRSGVVNGAITTNKIANPSFADIGSQITYTLVVTNIGNVTAQSVIVQDTIPLGTAFVPNSFTVNGINISGADPAYGYNVGNIAVGSADTITFRVTVTSIPTINPIINGATARFSYLIDPSLPLGTGGSSTNSNTTQVNNANFNANNGGFFKAADKLYTTVGDTVTYTLNLNNLGNIQATNVVITDSISSNVQFIPGSATINGVSVSGNPITGLQVGNINASAGAVVTFEVVVISTLPSTVLNNQAKVNYSYLVDPTSTPVNSSNLSNEVTSQINYVNVIINKVANTNVVYLNNNVIYTIQISNTGNVSANNVVVQDTLATGVTFVPGSVTINGVITPGANITTGVTLTSIPAGGNSIITFAAEFSSVPRGGFYNNTAKGSYSYIVDPSKPALSGTSTSNTSEVVVSLYISPNKKITNVNSICPNTNMNSILPTNFKGISVMDAPLATCPGQSIEYKVSGICNEAQKACIGQTISQYKMWQQLNVLANLNLGSVQIEEIDSITANVSIIRTATIVTPNTGSTTNAEGELLSGQKEIIEGVITYTVNIIAVDGSIVEETFNKLFSSFVIVGSDYKTTSLTAKTCVEDIEINSYCSGVINVTATLMTYLVPATNDNCGITCVSDFQGNIQCVSNSSLCSNIGNFLLTGENYWKEFNVFNDIFYEVGSIGELLLVKGDVTILDYKVITTPVALTSNNELLDLNGQKMLVNLLLTIKVNYLDSSNSGVVKRKNFSVPVGTYIMLGAQQANNCNTGNYNVKACIEDIYACNVNGQYVFTNTTLIVKAVLCNPTTCSQ